MIAGRRLFLSLVVVAALFPCARCVYAGERPAPPRPPRTVAAALDALEGLLSPEVLATLYTTPEAELVEWRRVISDIMTRRWEVRFEDPLRPLLQALEQQGVPEREASAYLLTSLVRRHRGLTLNTAEQLKPFREAKARKDEEELRRRRETGLIVTVDPLVIIDVVAFPANSARPSKGGQELLDAIAQTIRGNPQLRGIEVQGHAAANERGGRALSRKRARAVVDALIERGVSPGLLTEHGLGADCPIVWDGPRRADRDRRVDFFILPRSTQAPVP